MRDEFERWARTFPEAVAEGNEAFAGSEVASFVRHELPVAVREALPSPQDRYMIEGSAGAGQWTHTPWVAVLDPAITSTVQEGYYVVYLLSADGARLYLSLNQGCTRLQTALGIPGARETLLQRSALMRSRIKGAISRLDNREFELGSESWRGKLYEAGDVASVRYDTRALPKEDDIRLDLAEAIALYSKLVAAGGWEPDDEISRDAEDEAGITGDLVQAKRYKLHRTIERQPSHSKTVKRLQGFRCKGCDRQLDEEYGKVAFELIEAHHLTTLASLSDGEVVTFDPRRDFAVLCPNCHAVIHRMDDPSDLEGLRRLVRQ